MAKFFSNYIKKGFASDDNKYKLRYIEYKDSTLDNASISSIQYVPVLTIAKGILLFHCNRYGNESDEDSEHHVLKLLEDKYERQEDNYTYFYPVPYYANYIGLGNLNACHIMYTNQDINLICLINPSDFSKRDVKAENDITWGSNCPILDYDVCFSEEFMEQNDIYGCIAIPIGDSLTVTLQGMLDVPNVLKGFIQLCCTDNNNLAEDKTNEHILQLEGLMIDKHIGVPEFAIIPSKTFNKKDSVLTTLQRITSGPNNEPLDEKIGSYLNKKARRIYRSKQIPIAYTYEDDEYAYDSMISNIDWKTISAQEDLLNTLDLDFTDPKSKCAVSTVHHVIQSYMKERPIKTAVSIGRKSPPTRKRKLLDQRRRSSSNRGKYQKKGGRATVLKPPSLKKWSPAKNKTYSVKSRTPTPKKHARSKTEKSADFVETVSLRNGNTLHIRMTKFGMPIFHELRKKTAASKASR